MAHWRTVLPAAAMLEVEYEDMVEDFEPQARLIVAHCGLQWDPACLEFYKTSAAGADGKHGPGPSADLPHFCRGGGARMQRCFGRC